MTDVLKKLGIMSELITYQTNGLSRLEFEVPALESRLQKLLMRVLTNSSKHSNEYIIGISKELEKKKRMLTDPEYREQCLTEIRNELIAILQEENKVASSSTT